MLIRIGATFAATDGSMPESVDVTLENVDIEEVRTLMPAVLDTLLMAPTARRMQPSAAEVGRDVVEGIRTLAGPKCRRTACGHPRSAHARQMRPSTDTAQTDHESRWGPCGECNNKVQCEYFVGEGDGWK